MKAALFFTFMALALAGIFAIGDECNPDGDGKPNCTDSNVGQPSRNFWDPTAYWLCESADAEAEMNRCPSASLYDSATQTCIPAQEWVWTPPCPE